MNSVGDFGFGVGSGLAVGLALKAEAEAKGRRMSVRGNDQVLIKTKKSKEQASTSVASIHDDWYYESESIYKKHGFPFSFKALIVFSLISFVVEIIITAIGFINPKDVYIVFGVPILIGMLFGWVIGSTDKELDYIVFGESNGLTTILLKIYDDDGYRNFDEDEIDKIITMFEE